MASLVVIAGVLWLLAACIALTRHWLPFGRAYLVIGCVVVIAAVITTLPQATDAIAFPLGLPEMPATFRLDPAALWLLGFGLPGAAAAAWVGTPSKHKRQWTFGFAMSLIGAVGVFGMQDAVTFLIAWELMSLGGALMILGERLTHDRGRGALFMLALLEVGTIALLIALLLLTAAAQSTSFADFAKAALDMSFTEQLVIGLLLLIGFGAKIGLLPFYEWFPSAYGSGSGATGALLSGVILNAAYFALGRGLLQWLPATAGMPVSYAGIFVVTIAVASAILTALYAFQQDYWRQLLSFSSAENGAVAVTMLGIAMMFRQDGLDDLAGLAFVVGLMHLAGHALAKGALFLAADTVYRHSGSYELVQNGVLRRMPLIAGLGALIAALSLSAVPPTAGFASEWFAFQTVFQGFNFANLASRLVAVLAGAGLALTAAIALATFVKVYGIGLLGAARDAERPPSPPAISPVAITVLGGLVLVLGVGMPLWLQGLGGAATANTGTDSAALMHEGWLLVPLTSKFAFISPSALVIALPLLALVPIALLFLARRPLRRAPVWYGGQSPDPRRTATTALAFSNALRTFYNFVYRPTEQTGRETAPEDHGHPYFIQRLTFRHDVAPIFGPHLFVPIERLVLAIAGRFRSLQSGHLNIYLAIIGGLLVIILAVSLFA